MREAFTCGARERLVEYLYGEVEPEERAMVAAHVAGCAECAGELDALSDTRRLLAAWTPPEASLGWQVPGTLETVIPFAGARPERAQSRAWWREPLPAWAQAAAAVLIFAAGLAVGASDRATGPAPVPVASDLAPVPAASGPDWGATLAAVEGRLDAVERATRSQQTILAAQREAQEPPAAVMRRVQGAIAASEERMRGELAMQLIQLKREENLEQRFFSEDVDAKFNSHWRYVSQLIAER